MRTAGVIAILGLLAIAAPAYADEMPYFGATSHDGSYWNGPNRDYEASGPASSAGHGYAHPSRAQRPPNASKTGIVR